MILESLHLAVGVLVDTQTLLPLTLYWRGLRRPQSEIWTLLSLSDRELDHYVRENLPQLKSGWRAQALKELEWCDKNSVKILPIFHPDYIDSLKVLNRPPWLLSVLGETSGLNCPAITVVGGRQMSLAAAHWVETHLCECISASDIKISIISGGARGVDQKAHSVSVLNNVATWVHLPSGLAVPYPRSLAQMKDSILSTGGGLLSAYSPFEMMRKHHFIERNYNIALHGQYTLVVEARRRSGTLITAKASLDYGRSVGVVPSGPFDIGLGGLDLLRDGADMILNSADLNSVIKSVIENFSPVK